ncbi:MAG: rhodanese-like domain-containing protein [Pseudomonadota bacterium]|jgi:rhodanese-related sulfurtransferase
MIESISPAQLQQWLAEAASGTREAPVVVDVREGWEHAHVNLPHALHIPMQTVPGRLAELDRERPHVLMCHHGMRSYRVAEFLQQAGFGRLYNLDGGIDAWAAEVDTALPRY